MSTERARIRQLTFAKLNFNSVRSNEPSCDGSERRFITQKMTGGQKTKKSEGEPLRIPPSSTFQHSDERLKRRRASFAVDNFTTYRGYVYVHGMNE